MTPSLALARSKPGAAAAYAVSRDKQQMLPKAHEPNDQQQILPFQEDSPSPTKSQPLEDLPPAMNSPQKRHEDRGQSQPPAIEPPMVPQLNDLDTAQQENIPLPHSAPAEPAMLDQAQLDKTMTELLARQRSGLARTEAPLRRKERKLGRAPSGNSSALSFTRPTRFEVADSVDTASPLTFSGTDDKPPLPSQLLTYDAPGAEEHRRLMGLKMGMAFEEEASGRKVGGVGMVKDAETIGVGQRLRGRHRDK